MYPIWVDSDATGGEFCKCRNGIESVVLERSETLRSTGAAIMMHVNGWRALDQLGVASSLRKTAVAVQSSLFFHTLNLNVIIGIF